MSEARYTPGPWFLAPQLEPLGGRLARTVMATDTCVAEALFDDEDDPSAEANATLIAAAPDLVEALEEVLNSVGTALNDPLFFRVKNALAKAEGRHE